MTPLFAISNFYLLTWMVFLFGGGIAILAAILRRQRVNLRRLDRKLDALLKHQGISLPPIVSEEVQHILREPKTKPEAIKLHQEQTGLDLADATDDVEAFMAGKH